MKPRVQDTFTKRSYIALTLSIIQVSSVSLYFVLFSIVNGMGEEGILIGLVSLLVLLSNFIIIPVLTIFTITLSIKSLLSVSSTAKAPAVWALSMLALSFAIGVGGYIYIGIVT